MLVMHECHMMKPLELAACSLHDGGGASGGGASGPNIAVQRQQTMAPAGSFSATTLGSRSSGEYTLLSIMAGRASTMCRLLGSALNHLNMPRSCRCRCGLLENEPVASGASGLQHWAVFLVHACKQPGIELDQLISLRLHTLTAATR